MLPLSEIEALALFIKLFNLPDEIGEVSKENKYFRDSEERLAREINARLGARVSERERKSSTIRGRGTGWRLQSESSQL
jgi:hypothetical protein